MKKLILKITAILFLCGPIANAQAGILSSVASSVVNTGTATGAYLGHYCGIQACNALSMQATDLVGQSIAKKNYDKALLYYGGSLAAGCLLIAASQSLDAKNAGDIMRSARYWLKEMGARFISMPIFALSQYYILNPYIIQPIERRLKDGKYLEAGALVAATSAASLMVLKKVRSLDINEYCKPLVASVTTSPATSAISNSLKNSISTVYNGCTNMFTAQKDQKKQQEEKKQIDNIVSLQWLKEITDCDDNDPQDDLKVNDTDEVKKEKKQRRTLKKNIVNQLSNDVFNGFVVTPFISCFI